MHEATYFITYNGLLRILGQNSYKIWVEKVCLICKWKLKYRINSVQSLRRVRLFVTPWIAARQASLSITNSRSSLRLTSIQSVMPSSHLILCHPLLLLPPASESFPMSQLFAWGGQSTGVSALASFLPKKSQGWSPSERTGWTLLAKPNVHFFAQFFFNFQSTYHGLNCLRCVSVGFHQKVSFLKSRTPFTLFTKESVMPRTVSDT